MKPKLQRKITKSSSESNESHRAAVERRTKLLIALLCVGLSAIAVVPFFFMGVSENGGSTFELRMPTTHDMFLHYDQMRSFHNGLAAGEIYPRWEEDTNRGFGAPTTSYYPPGVYYLTSACYFIARDWVRALLDAHLLIMIASAAALYLYARQVMGRGPSLVAMTAYIFLPYHLVDQYQRGAIAELLAFIWMPLMLFFGDRLMKASSDTATSDTNRHSPLMNIAGLAATYGAFLWSHPATAYQFSLVFGVYILVSSIRRREWKGLLAVGVAMALGIGLSAAYLLPAAIEQNLIHKEYVAETWPYHKTYVFVHDLYQGSDVHRGFFHLIDWIWISGTALIGIGAVILSGRRTRSMLGGPLRQRFLLWIILGALASFMMTKASMPIGSLIPKIDIGVFTWRMLAITTLIVSLVSGACAQAAIVAGAQQLRSRRILFASMAAFVVSGAVLFSAFAVARPMMDSPVFEPETEHLNWATIPSTAPADPEELPRVVTQAELPDDNSSDESDEAPDRLPQAELSGENGDATVEQWKPQHRVVRATLTEDDQLLVHTFNFPGWTAKVDGNQAPIKTAEEYGDMEIELTEGTHVVTLDFLETPPRRAGRITTLSSFALLLAMACFSFIRNRYQSRVSS
ncbi:MAG TPA: hypothetical protein VGL29_18100 [Blastocatellia bacterium]